MNGPATRAPAVAPAAPQPQTATHCAGTAANPEHQDGSAPATVPTPGFRLHSGPPDYEKYRYGYPPTPGYMFGSGN